MEVKKLNCGCGNDYKEGWTNLDFNSKHKCDINHNLDFFPYPFEDNTFDEILCSEILEHIDDIFLVLDEIYRISKPNAKITIRVPHWSHYFAWSDLTHKSVFTSRTFNFLNEGHLNYPYSNLKFKFHLEKKHLTVYVQKNKKRSLNLIGCIIDWIINFNLAFTERFLCKFIPISHIFFYLRIIKP